VASTDGDRAILARSGSFGYSDYINAVSGLSDSGLRGCRTVAKCRDDVASTALGQLSAKDLKRPCGLVEELGGRLDDEPSGVSFPGLHDLRVNVGRGGSGFGS
jgi:hypothetical protein